MWPPRRLDNRALRRSFHWAASTLLSLVVDPRSAIIPAILFVILFCFAFFATLPTHARRTHPHFFLRPEATLDCANLPRRGGLGENIGQYI